MNEDYGFYYEDETSCHDENQHQKDKENNQKKKRVMNEIVNILRSLITIFDLINSKMNR